MKDLLTYRNLWRAIVVSAALFLLWLLFADVAFSQQVRSDVGYGIEQWSGGDKRYMNRMSVQVAVEAQLGALWTEGTVGGVWWGSDKAKISGSLWNVEAGKVLEYRRSFALAVVLKIAPQWALRLGGVAQRRGVHHIWQFKSREGRHDYFPAGWRVGISGCNGGRAPNWPPDGPQCPSIGYWDTVAPLLILEGRWLTARIEGPMRRWKDLTLPYPRVQYFLTVRPGKWRIGTRGEAFGPAGFGYDVEVSRSLPGAEFTLPILGIPIDIPPVEFLRIGLTASDHLSDPGWGVGPGDNLRRIGATLTVEKLSDPIL